MKHLTSPDFWESFDRLPIEIQRLARENYELLKANPRHPSVRLKKARGYWVARIGLHYRALGKDVEGGILWGWIGTHAEYDRILGFLSAGQLALAADEARAGALPSALPFRMRASRLKRGSVGPTGTPRDVCESVSDESSRRNARICRETRSNSGGKFKITATTMRRRRRRRWR